MNTRLFHSAIAAAALALTLWMAPVSSSRAQSAAQCSADAARCAGSAVGLAAACAASAITDGFTTALCIAAFLDTGDSCLALQNSCVIRTNPSFATIPTTTTLGNAYYFGNTSRDMKCNRDQSDMVHSVEYRMLSSRLVYLKIFCTSGSSFDFNNGDIDIRAERRVNGVTGERATCGMGEMVIGAFGSQDLSSTKVKSFGVLCGEIGFQYDVRNSVELGSKPTAASDSVSMGCPRGSYLSGFRIHYDPDYNANVSLTLRHVYGVTALCVS